MVGLQLAHNYDFEGKAESANPKRLVSLADLKLWNQQAFLPKQAAHVGRCGSSFMSDHREQPVPDAWEQ